MITAQQIAQEIDKLQPDLKEFWSEALKLQLSDAVAPLFNAPYTPLNAFKIDLLFTHHQTHTRSYVSSQASQAFVKYAANHNLPLGPININKYASAQHYNLHRSGTNRDKLIITHVQDPRKYMSPYLKTATGGTTAIHKTLEDNQMSLAVFTSWVSQQKPFNSVQALTFLNQIRHFRDHDVREGFYRVILTHCPKPSIELQRDMENTSPGDYPSISRAHLRGKANNDGLLAFGAIHDTCDSGFNPFVANLTTTPTKNTNQFESVLSIALVLLQAGTHNTKLTESESITLINSVVKYATMPEHQPLLDPLKANLRNAATAINKLLGMLA